ncbi:hypothetical protein [Paraburkholderia aromaticivorans]|uniref:hypothetical protein n=1 Tax=Paraburkholderia aromaticivorans TaxID=2026199 RepID=UPI001455F3A5|nr:hypothetical protein [Paraburkholderia aromaticivorans]
MDSLPDEAREARQTWLCEMQHDQTRPQSDFEKSAIWRGVFVAAFIVTVINIPVSPPTMQTHAPVRATA